MGLSPKFQRIAGMTKAECDQELEVIAKTSEILSRPEANTHSSEWRYVAEWKDTVNARLKELKQ